MPNRSRLDPPRHPLVLFLGVMGLLACALGWLGWRLLQQDRDLADQQMRTRLESAADGVADELDRRIAGIEQTLADAAVVSAREAGEILGRTSDTLPDGAVMVLIDDDGVIALPSGRLLYSPGLEWQPQSDPLAFVSAEALEFRQRNYPEAIRSYRTLAQSADKEIRAGALLRLGRVLRKSGRPEEALAAFSALAELGHVAVGGLPAELIGSYGRIEVLRQLGREGDLRRDATSFRAALASGTWPIGRATYQFYHDDLDRLVPDRADPMVAEDWRIAVSDGVARLWQRAVMSSPAGKSDREIVVSGGRVVLLLWHQGQRRATGFVATDDFVASQWLRGLAANLQQQGMSLALSDPAGRLPAAVGEVNMEVVRVPAQTGLPWAYRIALNDPDVALADLGERRSLLATGLVLLGLVVLLGGYAVTRAVRRELEVSRLQAEFVSAVSHEFRTPLTSMRQLTELLSSGRVAGEERREQYYRVIDRETQRLHRLVEGLLDFGRMEAGAHEFTREQLEVTGFVHGVVGEFRAERPDSSLTIDQTTTAAEVMADREALARALWNLLDNAVKYSPEGSPVEVAVETRGARVAIGVRDHGIGIPPEEIDGVFEKFVRGTSSRSIPVKGTGLGLAMVRHIVEAHGGEIEVVSSSGEGSTFTLLLPIREAA